MITDKNRVPELEKMLKKLSTAYLEVGILGESDSKILLIANVNEYGANITVTDKMRGYLGSQGLHLKKDTTTIKIPERAFIRGSYDKNKNKIYKFDEELERVLNLELDVEEFLTALGHYCVGLIQDYMKDLKKPANHPLTIANKGSSNPLIDTGRLINAIDFKVKYR